MGAQLACGLEADALVRFEVSLLSGVTRTITCMPTAPR